MTERGEQAPLTPRNADEPQTGMDAGSALKTRPGTEPDGTGTDGNIENAPPTVADRYEAGVDSAGVRLTRRFILAAAAASACSAMVPAHIAAATEATPSMWFLVGDEESCEFIRATTENDAIRQWLIDRVGGEECEVVSLGGTATEDCDCYTCQRRSEATAYHVKRLDGRESVPVTEYWAEGRGIRCCECEHGAMDPSEGEIIDGQLYCNDCLDEVRKLERGLREAEAEDAAIEQVARGPILPLPSPPIADTLTSPRPLPTPEPSHD